MALDRNLIDPNSAITSVAVRKTRQLGLSPFLLAVAEENVDLTYLMLQSGKVFKDSKDMYGRSALHYAAANGNVQLAKLLIDNGADPNILNNAEESPLMKACQFVELGTIEFLLSIPTVDIHRRNVVCLSYVDGKKCPRYPLHAL